MAANKERLDVALVRRGLVPGRERARALIMAGQVYVGERMVDKPGTMVPLDANCHLAETPEALKYVSRGGLKLEKALDTFHLSPEGLVALDVGASTGGFTQVLLERGAKRVYAVDVGHGQLAWTLRNDARVVVMEHTNIRHLTSLPEPIHCVAIDVSFISLRLVLPAVVPLLARSSASQLASEASSLRETGAVMDGGAQCIAPLHPTPHQPESQPLATVADSEPTVPWIAALVKPQFEAGKAEADRGSGVITDPTVHARILQELSAWIPEHTPLHVRGLTDSPIFGREGNREFLLYLGI